MTAVDFYLTVCSKLIDAESAHHVLETAMAVNCEESVMKCVMFSMDNMERFKRIFSCYISRQKLFFTSIHRILQSIAIEEGKTRANTSDFN